MKLDPYDDRSAYPKSSAKIKTILGGLSDFLTEQDIRIKVNKNSSFFILI
jgi:hypothetical protein